MKTAKVFWNGRSQAVRLPREFRFDTEEVYVRRVGSAVLLIPKEGSWEPLRESLELFGDDFMAERHQPESQERESLFS